MRDEKIIPHPSSCFTLISHQDLGDYMAKKDETANTVPLTYVVNTPLQHDQQSYAPGDTLTEITEEQAAVLLEIGVLGQEA